MKERNIVIIYSILTDPQKRYPRGALLTDFVEVEAIGVEDFPGCGVLDVLKGANVVVGWSEKNNVYQ